MILDWIPNLQIAEVENTVFMFALARYVGLALLGASINFAYQLYIIAEKKKGMFSFSTFWAENWKSSIFGFWFSVFIVMAAFLTGILGIDFSYAHNALAISLGAGVDGAITYYFDHIVKAPDKKNEAE